MYLNVRWKREIPFFPLHEVGLRRTIFVYLFFFVIVTLFYGNAC